MNYTLRREQVIEQMQEDSVLILYSGVEIQASADAYYPFVCDRHFFYLTGLRAENMILFMTKKLNENHVTLFLPAVDKAAERWTGKMTTVEEAKEISGIDDVLTLDRADAIINRTVSEGSFECAYFNTHRNAEDDLPHYNLVKAGHFAEKHPGLPIRNLWPMVTSLRMEKDADEINLLREAIKITDHGLQNVLRHLKPEQKEYQAQAEFEYTIYSEGAESVSFPTIAGSGVNGTMLHYETNRDECHDAELLLLDLGARVKGYNADITRTYPIGGKFTERQKAVYDVVLRANREMVRIAKAGMTLRELNDRCKEVLAEGCIELGLIKDPSEIRTYYMHSVGHHLGIDVHDVTLPDSKLTPGCVITDEPGLYIDEWKIGIRIEDDLLITEDGCECLSDSIIRTTDEIEAYMRENASKL